MFPVSQGIPHYSCSHLLKAWGCIPKLFWVLSWDILCGLWTGMEFVKQVYHLEFCHFVKWYPMKGVSATFLFFFFPFEQVLVHHVIFFIHDMISFNHIKPQWKKGKESWLCVLKIVLIADRPLKLTFNAPINHRKTISYVRPLKYSSRSGVRGRQNGCPYGQFHILHI